MNLRLRFLIILVGALLVAAIFTFPIWQPLLSTESAEVVFAGLPADLVPAFQALPQVEQQAYLALAAEDQEVALLFVTTALSPDTLAPPEDDALPQLTGALQIASAEFSELDTIRWATGEGLLIQQADGITLVRLENFRAARAPAMYLALSSAEDPQTIDEIGLDRFDLGLLKGTLGNQNYLVPAEVDITRFNSLVLYSRALNLIISVAPLRFLV